MNCVDMVRSAISEKTSDCFPVYEENKDLKQLLMMCADRLDECLENNDGDCVSVDVSDDMLIVVSMQMLSFDPAKTDDPLMDVLHVAVYMDLDVIDEGENIMITLTLPGVWDLTHE